jgi:hypothetical protein
MNDFRTSASLTMAATLELVDLGADPLAVDGSGFPAVDATAPDTDRRLMEKIRDMTSAEGVAHPSL